ncbi:hypothetical protein CLV62_10986 [Dysgonomonas alginatilytica]|uniref:Phosphodiester glycosidase domain-containing protein n=1 Tax=Dysgonomonas alginatilytica TaxID=1605892 RepID=A0A2V3PS50_9BACT|nr:phosphodiester glycosidase family protein [Dysgonomonas alginatilytica]PXV64760.1 hypothetical protein CLV62_10986 [Dysgonomonas alginatilytica]
MSTKNNKDNEVYILGSEVQERKKIAAKGKWLIFSICFIIILIAIYVIFFTKEQTPEYYFEPENTSQESILMPIDSTDNSDKAGYLEILSDTINDVPLSVYIPHKATMSLVLGMPDKSDSTIIFAAMAADIRKDNQEIVGDFVLSGKQLSRGVAKKGFCAIDNKTITIGIGESTPLLEQVINNNGSFFRQYPLVHNGELVENKPKNKSVRRALAVRNEQVLMIESKNTESFHDFSQALIDIGVSNAIYLVGGNAYGWYYDKEHILHEFGEELSDLPQNISYIIWRIE